MNGKSRRCTCGRAIPIIPIVAGVLLATTSLGAKESFRYSGSMTNLGEDTDATAKVKAKLSDRRSKIDFKIRNLDQGNYRLLVGGEPWKEFEPDARGRARLRLDSKSGLLNADPRGESVVVNDGSADILEITFSSSGDPGDAKIDERTTIDATSLAAGATAAGRFRLKRGIQTLSLRIRDAPPGDYQLFVGGDPHGTYTVDRDGKAVIVFDSDPRRGELFLDFEPRGEVIDLLLDGQVHFSDDLLSDASGVNLCGEVDVEFNIDSTGADTDGFAVARYRVLESCEQKLRLELEDVPAGDFIVTVNGREVADTTVDPGGEVEIHFSTERSEEDFVLDFELNGAVIEISSEGTVYFSDIVDDFDLGSDPEPTPCEEKEIELPLEDRGVVPGAEGEAEWEARADCDREFSVEVVDVPVGDYQVFVGGNPVGMVSVAETDEGRLGEVKFDSDPDHPNEMPLDFDPLDAMIEVMQGGQIILSGLLDSNLPPPPPDVCEDEEKTLRLPFLNQGAVPGGSGDVRFRVDDNCDEELTLQVEDVPAGDYEITVGGTVRGTLSVEDVEGETEGEVEFNTDPDAGERLMDFDPRGATIEIRRADGTLLFSRQLPPV